MVLASAAVLLGLGYWTYRAVEGSVRELRAASMKNLLDSEVNSLQVWVREEIGDAERIARDPRVRDAVAALLRVALSPQRSQAELCAGPARAALEVTLRPLLREIGDATFNLISRGGRLIATRFVEYCGLRLNAERFLPLLEPVFAGESRFLRPFNDADRVAAPARLRRGPPFAWIATPVRDAGERVIAVLSIAEPADAVFASILQAARPGESGDAYAYDEHGAILSGAWAGESAPLHARRGGGEREGVVLDPYLNHRGVETIGVWRWLPEYGLGVAIEISAAEAYAPLRYLNIAFGVVFGALVIAVAAALAAGLSVLRLRNQVGEARRLGAYALEERIGEGGMAVVYRARHALLKRPCAVKLLRPARANDETIARFEREVQLASQLAHPNTVEIFDYGRTADGHFYYAMEYLDGITLAELVSRGGAVPVPRALHVLRQLCAGLAEAHARGLVHRDVKPENIMVCRRGGEYDVVKILDFGLVKSIAEPHSRDLTRTLRILGTPLYMAPERLRNPADVDARADIYAVGAVAFFLLTGRRMFDAPDDLALTTRVLNDEPPRVAAAAAQPVPLELDLLVQSCLEKKREDRPQRVTDLVEALEALTQEHRWTQREAESWWRARPPPR
ncbi:MAG: serine/threonine protein kinase [Betaproteobacteria bacterium]|nr:MAG: serine/threonine protein kinase [Betaproteobacteria bacterium]